MRHVVRDQAFAQAYVRVRARYTARTWQNVSAREITDEIYKEMRLLDLQISDEANANSWSELRLAAE
jgi:hypothetical protein